MCQKEMKNKDRSEFIFICLIAFHLEEFQRAMVDFFKITTAAKCWLTVPDPRFSEWGNKL